MFADAGDTALRDVQVLVVEDHFPLARLLQKMLEANACRVVGPAPTLEKATALAAAETFDVAILDVNLNGVPVFPLATLLRERKVPFVFSSGYDDLALPEEFRSTPRLGKPYTEEQLIERLLEVLGPRPQ